MKSNLPAFAQTHNPGPAQANLTAACTMDGTGAKFLLKSGPRGAMVTKIVVTPRVTLAQQTGVVLFEALQHGATLAAKETGVLPQFTLTNAGTIPRLEFSPSESEPIRLGPAAELWVGALVAAGGAGIDVTAEYTDY